MAVKTSRRNTNSLAWFLTGAAAGMLSCKICSAQRHEDLLPRLALPPSRPFQGRAETLPYLPAMLALLIGLPVSAISENTPPVTNITPAAAELFVMNVATEPSANPATPHPPAATRCHNFSCWYRRCVEPGSPLRSPLAVRARCSCEPVSPFSFQSVRAVLPHTAYGLLDMVTLPSGNGWCPSACTGPGRTTRRRSSLADVTCDYCSSFGCCVARRAQISLADADAR